MACRHEWGTCPGMPGERATGRGKPHGCLLLDPHPEDPHTCFRCGATEANTETPVLVGHVLEAS